MLKHLSMFLLVSFAGLTPCLSQSTQTGERPARISLSKERQDSLRRKVPEATGYLSDFANLFTAVERASLDSLIRAYQQKTTVQIAIATITSEMISEEDFEDYTFVLINTWGVGEKKTKNGILIAIAPGMRRMRIQNGYGIEAYLSDRETKEIIDGVFIPRFKEGNYFDGIKEGILAITRELGQSGL